MNDKNECKKVYWHTLHDMNYAQIGNSEVKDPDIPENELPDDIVINPNGEYVKCTQNLSSDKLMLYNQIKAKETLEQIEKHLGTITIYISIAFWLAVISAVIFILPALIKLL